MCVKNLIKTPYYSPGVSFFGQKLNRVILTNKDTIGKSILSAAERRKFQLHSTFQ